MRIVHAKRALPRCFKNHPAGKEIVAEVDLASSRRSRLRAKLLLFPHPTALQRFWLKALGYKLGRYALGAVNSLSREIHYGPKLERRRVEVDPRYACIIGLAQSKLSMEIIVHESVHAGFAFAKRHRGDFWLGPNAFDEENICYPAGAIAGAINRFLQDNRLYRWQGER